MDFLPSTSIFIRLKTPTFLVWNNNKSKAHSFDIQIKNLWYHCGKYKKYRKIRIQDFLINYIYHRIKKFHFLSVVGFWEMKTTGVIQ